MSAREREGEMTTEGLDLEGENRRVLLARAFPSFTDVRCRAAATNEIWHLPQNQGCGGGGGYLFPDSAFPLNMQQEMPVSRQNLFGEKLFAEQFFGETSLGNLFQ